MLTGLDKVVNLEHSHNLWRVIFSNTYFECFARHSHSTVKLHLSSTVHSTYIRMQLLTCIYVCTRYIAMHICINTHQISIWCMIVRIFSFEQLQWITWYLIHLIKYLENARILFVFMYHVHIRTYITLPISTNSYYTCALTCKNHMQKKIPKSKSYVHMFIRTYIQLYSRAGVHIHKCKNLHAC